ncbi:TPA: LysR family transcriptional regulator [Escherichia coli]
MNITLRQIKYFVSTAESGSLSTAAKSLNISQSAITTAIQGLERDIGYKLLIRSKSGVDLTDEGRLFLYNAYNIIRTYDEAINTVHVQKPLHGTVSIAATYTIMGYFLPVHLKQFSRIYPHIKLELFENQRSIIETGLLSGKYDIGIVINDNLTCPDIVSETLLRSERRIWLPSGHPLLEKEILSLNDIVSEPFIILDVDEAWETAKRYWNTASTMPVVILHTHSVEAVRSMVANDMGITILSDMVYRPWSLEGKRIETRALSKSEVFPMSIGLAWRNNVEFTPAMQAFINYFRKIFMCSPGYQNRNVDHFI